MKILSGKWIVLVIVLLALVTAVTAGWGRYMAQPGPLMVEKSVVIETGMGPRAMAKRLADEGVIGNAEAFVLAVRVMRLAPTLKAGEYAFGPQVSLRTVINKIATGDTESRNVTFPEGWTVRQVVERMRGTQGLSGTIIVPEEGMLFPDTYDFQAGTAGQKIVDVMKARMEKELADAWAMRDVNIPLKTPQELLILASIVQKEAANEEEMPKIAAVFINRLRKGMKLQSDPTVIYGADYDGNIRKKDLTEPHPFNTYVFAGLPPTAIACPGRAALRAVARPDVINALFFVADPSRTMHVFSETYEEHQKNVDRYWREVAK